MPDNNKECDNDFDELEHETNLPFINTSDNQYIDEEDPTFQCEFCGALLWFNEKLKREKVSTRPKFSICCSKGKIQVSFFKPPPPALKSLFF